MTTEDINAIADAIALRQNHGCRFDEQEAKAIHRLAQTLQNGGMQNFEAVIAFGASLRDARKAGVIALTGAIVLGVAGLMWRRIAQ